MFRSWIAIDGLILFMGYPDTLAHKPAMCLKARTHSRTDLSGAIVPKSESVVFRSDADFNVLRDNKTVLMRLLC